MPIDTEEPNCDTTYRYGTVYGHQKKKGNSLVQEVDMEVLSINDFVEVKASGIRFGHTGRVVNQFVSTRPLYAVQFPDNSVAFFEMSEIERIPPQDSVQER
ncbi:hypothetical protein M1N82_02370 [Dehalococcoidia bacterium]|nr:hypothetical protein [Dehalococcoidia bacterium]